MNVTVTVTVHERDGDRDRDLTSVQGPEMINTNSFGIVTVTVTFMDGHGVVTEPSQKRWKYCI